MDRKPKVKRPCRVATIHRADGTEELVNGTVITGSHFVAFRFDQPQPINEGDTVSLCFTIPFKERTDG